MLVFFGRCSRAKEGFTMLAVCSRQSSFHVVGFTLARDARRSECGSHVPGMVRRCVWICWNPLRFRNRLGVSFNDSGTDQDAYADMAWLNRYFWRLADNLSSAECTTTRTDELWRKLELAQLPTNRKPPSSFPDYDQSNLNPAMLHERRSP